LKLEVTSAIESWGRLVRLKYQWWFQLYSLSCRSPFSLHCGHH